MDLIVIYECLSQETEFGYEFDACVGVGVQVCLGICADIIDVKPSRAHWAKRDKKVGLLFYCLDFSLSIRKKLENNTESVHYSSLYCVFVF